MTQSSLLLPPAPPRLTTFGVVSFLNARPLREFLPSYKGVAVKGEVPSRLIGMLDGGECDIALLPVVDYWRNRDRLTIVSDACIAGDGETLTVRVYSRRPPDRVERLHVDGDSHTSIILAQLIWMELYNRKLEVIPWQGGEPDGDAGIDSLLLIGDKVVTQAPRGYGFEVDLGAAWKHLTHLPFVFAAWYGRARADHARAARILSDARDAGVADARRIAIEAAAAHGWPEGLAIKYLCDIMKFKLTSGMRAGMDRFFQMAERRGLFE